MTHSIWKSERRAIWLLPWAGLALLACHDPLARRPDTQKGGAPVTLTSPAAVKMKEGPALKPAGALLGWLNQNARRAGKKVRFRLPVAVRFEDEHRLAIGAAHIGTDVGANEADAIELALDDTGLGVALLDTLRQRAPKGQPGLVLWLEGYWGELMDVPLPEFGAASADGKKRWPFAVLRVHQTVGPDGAAHVQVEE